MGSAWIGGIVAGCGGRRVALWVVGAVACQGTLPGADPGSGPVPAPPVDRGLGWTASSDTRTGATLPSGGPPAEVSDIWVSDTVLVRPLDGIDAETLAEDLDTGVDSGGDSAYLAVHVPPDRSAAEYLALLRQHPWIDQASRTSFVQGSGAFDDMARRAHPGQWHLVASRAPLPDGLDLSDVVVAVLDTGVAYEHHQDERHTYVPAPSLEGVGIVAPWDFVNDDEHANDDHQHGTHIASLIASVGAVEGTAPGVTLMPVKVLDADNRGTEIDLVAGIHHAVDHGADVINMSLSFPSGYVPSRALEHALVRAHEAGVVMVAAAGNHGLDTITWPAASPLVVGVGASQPSGEEGPDGDWHVDYVHEAPYSNRSNALDLLAPGGVLDRDRTGDTWVDGMLAETILPGDPSQITTWLYAGTSQAAAVVSGAAAYLLHQGAPPHRVGRLLHHRARRTGLSLARFSEGIGGGSVDVEHALDAHDRDDRHMRTDHEPSAGLLVFLGQTDDGIVPTARVWPVDAAGEPLPSRVLGTLAWGSHAMPLHCEATEAFCDLVGPTFPADADDTAVDAFVFTVDGVVIDNNVFRPTAAVFLTDAAEVLLAAVEADASLSGALIGFHLPAGADPVLGEIAASYMVHNHGTGLGSVPTAAILRDGATGAVALVQVDLDGSGLLSSPLGLFPAQRLERGGGQIVSFDGSGLLSSPLGLHPAGFHGSRGPAGSGLLSSPLGLTGSPMDLGRQRSTAKLDGSHLGAALQGRGFRFASEEEAVNAMVGSGHLPVRQSDAAGSGAESMPVE